MSDPFVTPEATLLYNHLFKPWRSPQYPNSTPKYSAMLLLDPKDKEIAPLLAAHAKEIMEKWPDGPPKMDFSNCLIQATDRFPEHPEWAGLLILNSSKKPDFGIPKVMTPPGTPVLDPSEIYPGCRVRVHIHFWTFARGVAADLHAVMKYADGEPVTLGNAPDSKAAFANVPGAPAQAPFADAPPATPQTFV